MSVVQYLDLPSAARLTGVSVTKVYRFIHNGDLAIYKIDGKFVVKVEDLLKQKTDIKDCELLEPTFMNLISEVKSENIN
ncbi:MAG: helix-turn-helix domain-containing protein [Gammaproteobacteria bacterium]|nr:MAG: helix-turn-helix domain-containing protein [Gammaproteobacteria bacterium]